MQRMFMQRCDAGALCSIQFSDMFFSHLSLSRILWLKTFAISSNSAEFWCWLLFWHNFLAQILRYLGHFQSLDRKDSALPEESLLPWSAVAWCQHLILFFFSLNCSQDLQSSAVYLNILIINFYLGQLLSTLCHHR